MCALFLFYDVSSNKKNSHTKFTPKFTRKFHAQIHAQIHTQIHTQNHAENHTKIHTQVHTQNSHLDHLAVGRQRTAVYFGKLRWGLEGRQRADAGQWCVLENFGMDWEDSGRQTADGGVHWDSVSQLKFTAKQKK